MPNRQTAEVPDAPGAISTFLSDPGKYGIFDPLRDAIKGGLGDVVNGPMKTVLDDTVKGIGTEMQKATLMGAGALAVAQPLISRMFPTKVQMEGGGGQQNPMQRGFRNGIRSPNFTSQFKSAPTG